jgi:hypothetical protein
MRRPLRAIAILLCFGLAGAELLGARAQAQQRAFDHFMTGFPLAGSHYSVDCTSCHVNGRFKGTPRQCIGCHNGGIAPGQRSTHGPTTANCEACHTTATWVQVRFNHNPIIGACASCHNGAHARAKPPTHLDTAAPCETCHKSTTRTPAMYISPSANRFVLVSCAE